MFSWFRELFVKLLKGIGNLIVDGLEWLLDFIRTFLVEVIDKFVGFMFDLLPDGALSFLGNAEAGLSQWDLIKGYAQQNLGFVGWLFPIGDVVQITTAVYLIIGVVRLFRWVLAAIPFSWFKVS